MHKSVKMRRKLFIHAVFGRRVYSIIRDNGKPGTAIGVYLKKRKDKVSSGRYAYWWWRKEI